MAGTNLDPLEQAWPMCSKTKIVSIVVREEGIESTEQSSVQQLRTNSNAIQNGQNVNFNVFISLRRFLSLHLFFVGNKTEIFLLLNRACCALFVSL